MKSLIVRQFQADETSFKNIAKFYLLTLFIRTCGSLLLKIQEQVKNNPILSRRTSLKFALKVVNKTAASAAQFAKCIFLHA